MAKKIRHSEEYLDINNIASNINALFGEAQPIFEHRKKMYERYNRALKKIPGELIVPLEYYIVNIASGYFGGKEPKYKVKKTNETKKSLLTKIFKKIFGDKNNPEEFQCIIDYITKYNDNETFFYELVKDYLITSACYGVVYENNDNEIVYAQDSSLNNIAIWNFDVPCRKIGLLRYWDERTATGKIRRHLEIITENYRKCFIDGKDKKEIKSDTKFEFKEEIIDEEEREENYWTDLPAVAIENPDGLALFELVISIIEKHEQIIKNNSNIFQYNDAGAKLKITGYMPKEKRLISRVIKDSEGKEKTILIPNEKRIQEDEDFLNAKIFYTPDKSGDIDWITKNINDSASENHKKTLLDLALMISGVPNCTDQGFTDADNSSALEKKFFPLDQVLQEADKLFKNELLRMWEMITDRINLKKSTNYDFRDIDVILIRNLPSNNQEIIDNWLKLRGLISDKTIIEHLPYDLDAESELNEIDIQNQENIEKNIENMKEMGKENSTLTEKNNPNKEFENNNEEESDEEKKSELTKKDRNKDKV